jgi:hypothetical protein
LALVEQKYHTARELLRKQKTHMRALVLRQEEDRRNIVEWASVQHTRAAEEFAVLLKENRAELAGKYAEEHIRKWEALLSGDHRAEEVTRARPQRRQDERPESSHKQERSAHIAAAHEERTAESHSHSTTDSGTRHRRATPGVVVEQRPREHRATAHYQTAYQELVRTSREFQRSRSHSSQGSSSSGEGKGGDSEASSDEGEHIAAPKVTTTPPRPIQPSRRGKSPPQKPAPLSEGLKHVTEQHSVVRFSDILPIVSRLSDEEMLRLHAKPPSEGQSDQLADETLLSFDQRQHQILTGAGERHQLSHVQRQPTSHKASQQQPSYLKPTQTVVARARTAEEEAAAPQMDIHPPSSVGDIGGCRRASRHSTYRNRGRAVSNSRSPMTSPARNRAERTAHTALAASTSTASNSIFRDRASETGHGRPSRTHSASKAQANDEALSGVAYVPDRRPHSDSRRPKNYRHDEATASTAQQAPARRSYEADDVRRSFADDDYEEFREEEASRRKQQQMPPRFEQIAQQTKERLRR